VPRVSVIVPIFNGTAFLPAFFQSLNAALPQDSQVILVDDGSTEPVWDTMPEIPNAGSILRLRNDTNMGYSVAANRGFAATDGDIIVQLNTDLILEAECIRAMVDLIERERQVGIVGSKLIYPTTGLLQHIGMAFGNHTKPHIFAELPASHPLCCRTREMQITTGATVAMTRHVLDRLGPLDEQYFNHNEDIEHCLLAVKHGFRNFTCAESIAHHWESQSGPARFARVMSSEGLFWSRWGSDYRPDLGTFVDEALDHVLEEAPHLQGSPFEVLDLTRGADQAIVLERLADRWAGLKGNVRRARQMNNPAERLSLSLLLPHWIAAEPTPLIYLVDRYRELEENTLWLERRRQVVQDELIVDLSGAALRTSELPPLR
jgi:GT2 family glycosyltransferase